MAKIASSNTKPEVLIRKYLFSEGFRYRINVKKLPGKPDIVLARYHTVIFIHGCFWHGHTCKYGKLPDTNYEFWSQKIEKNKERDNYSIVQLKNEGWKVIVIWQCEIRNKEERKMLFNRLTKELKINI